MRPHEALQGRVPAELYKPPSRTRLAPKEFLYPSGWIVRRVYADRGLISVNACALRIGAAFKGLNVGLEPLDREKHRAWLGPVDLGEIDVPLSVTEIDTACSRFIEKPTQRRKRAA